jgi:hypothetical protein
LARPSRKNALISRKLFQHGVGRKGQIAGAGALRGEEQEGRNQCGGADHDVAVDRQHAHQPGTVEQHRARH